MYLGADQLLKLVKKNKLVEGLSERELKNPEGAGFDLRIGELYQIKGKGFLGVTERETPDIKPIAKFNKNSPQKISLKSHTYYLLKTIESVNMPNNLLAIMTPRSTLFRSGVFIFGGQVPPGYKGGLNMGIYNFRDRDFDIEMGSRVVHIMFSQVKGKSNLYRGQWQGGRSTTKKREKQV